MQKLILRMWRKITVRLDFLDLPQHSKSAFNDELTIDNRKVKSNWAPMLIQM